MKRNMAFEKYQVKLYFVNRLEDSGLDIPKLTLLESEYYLSALLDSVKEYNDFWSIFPPYLHNSLRTFIDEPKDLSFIQNKDLQDEIAKRYPKGEEALKQYALLKLIE